MHPSVYVDQYRFNQSISHKVRRWKLDDFPGLLELRDGDVPALWLLPTTAILGHVGPGGGQVQAGKRSRTPAHDALPPVGAGSPAPKAPIRDSEAEKGPTAFRA